MSPPPTLQLDDLAANLVAMARSRVGRLAALTVGIPPNAHADDVARLLRERLAGLGHPSVDVATQPVLGPLRVLWVEFER